MNKMYKFTIEYYYLRYHTGGINTDFTRPAIVYADSLVEATKKIVKVDNDFEGTAKVSFEEMREDNYY